MGTRAWIAMKTNNKIIATYHHHLGYPEYLGFILNKYWNDPQKIKEAIQKGQTSEWGRNINENLYYEEISKEHKEKSWAHPNEKKMLEEFLDKYSTIAYCYLYKEGQWQMIKHTNERTNLKKYIEENNIQIDCEEEEIPEKKAKYLKILIEQEKRNKICRKKASKMDKKENEPFKTFNAKTITTIEKYREYLREERKKLLSKYKKNNKK